MAESGRRFQMLLMGLFSLATLYYCVQSFLKFREHKISESMHRESAGATIEYPSITICSGFRDGRRSPVLVAKERQNSTEDSVALLGYNKVREMSYNRSEYLTYFTQAIDNYWLNNLLDQEELWSDEYHEYYGGRCATFNPKNETKPGQVNSVIFGIQWPYREYTMNCDVFTKTDCYYYFAIFLHPKDGFVYNKGTKFIGQSFMYPTNKARVYYTLEKRRKTLLNKDHEQCSPETTLVDWKKCFLKVYDDRAGCIYPWLVKSSDNRSLACNLSQTYARVTSMEQHTWWDIDSVVSEETGCLKPCDFDEYNLKRLPYEYPLIPGNWVFPSSTQAVVQIFYLDTVVVTTEEYLAYDIFSLFGELGGAVGLFLGWSLMQMAQDAFATTTRILRVKK